jgi:hypothetical protein
MAAALAAALLPLAANAASWRDHATPYTFKFGNDIDTHQQTFLQNKGELVGFFYVKFTGDVTTDGLRVARHVNCNTEGAGCTAAWQLRGRPAMATFLYHTMPDLPVFHIPRQLIPQPGAYTHFHWRGSEHPMPGVESEGYLLELKAIDTFCFVHHDMAMPAGSCTDIGGLPVAPGIDTSTHTNIVTSVENNGTGGH